MKAKREKADIANRICSIYAAFLACPYLLTIPPAGYAAISEWKHHWFLGGAILFCCAMAGCIAWEGLQKKKNRTKGISKAAIPVTAALLAYLLFTVLSALLSPYGGVWIGNTRYDGALTITLYVLTTLLLMRSFRPRPWLLALFGASVSVMCVLGMAQLTGANPLTLYPAGYNYYGAGVYYASAFWGTIGNIDFCAALLSLSAGAFLAALIRGKTKRAWLYAIPAAISVFSLIELDVEAGLLALLAGLLILPAFVVTKPGLLPGLCQSYAVAAASAALGKAIRFYEGGARLAISARVLMLIAIAALFAAAGVVLPRVKALAGMKPERLRRALASLAAALMICAILVVYALPSLPAGFLMQAHDLLHGNADETFGSGRIHIWAQVWQAIWERPLFGGGPDTLSLRNLEGFSRYSEELNLIIIGTVDVAHNEYLNIWVNQGTLALCAHLAVLALSAVRWWKDAEQDETALAGAAVLFYVIQAFFGISVCSTAVYFWGALAILNRQTAPKR